MPSLIPYLSPDIFFNILVYLPADILYNVVRYVCRDWYNIISSPQFIDAHLHLKNSERGLLINQFKSCIHYVDGMTKKNDDDDDSLLQIDEVCYFDDKPNYGIGTSCNGLVAKRDYQCNIWYVENIVTKEKITIPPPRGNWEFLIMGYTRLSKHYKLVLFYINHWLAVECGILTLGVDKEWRSLFQVHRDTEIQNFGCSNFFSRNLIISAEGILHVIHSTLPLVFNLDLATETFYTRATPKPREENMTTYVGNGRSLCFLDYIGKFSWELWLLKDAETGEWFKRATIDLGPQEQMLRRTLCPIGFVLVPVGFLKDGEIVVFYVLHKNGNREWNHYNDSNSHPLRNCITYNIKTGGRINSFHLDKGYTYEMDLAWRYIPHVKSLVSPKFVAS